MASLEKSLIGELDAFTRMKDLLEGELFQTYDFILIDSARRLLEYSNRKRFDGFRLCYYSHESKSLQYAGN